MLCVDRTEEIEWTKLNVDFALPVNTSRIAVWGVQVGQQGKLQAFLTKCLSITALPSELSGPGVDGLHQQGGRRLASVAGEHPSLDE